MFINLVGKIWQRMPRAWRLCIIRLTQKKFTASVAAIIVNKRGEVLLLDHVLRPHSSWGLPGGFLEHGENPDDALRRELLEETGITLTDIELFRIRTPERHIEMLFRASSEDIAEVRSREIRAVGWYMPNKLPEELSLMQRRLIEEICLNGKKSTD